jgi:transcriptional regulator with XRE-family HTH domain
MTAQIIPLRKVAKSRRPRGPYRKPSPERQKRRDDYYRAFGERLKYARAQLGITEEETAAVFDVTVRTYRGYEAGKRPFICYKGFEDFADTFGVSLRWLVGHKDTEAEARGFACVLFSFNGEAGRPALPRYSSSLAVKSRHAQ